MSDLMAKLKAGKGKQAAALKAAAAKGGYKKDDRFWKWTGVDVEKLTDKGKKQKYVNCTIRILPVSFADMMREENGELAEHQVLSPIVTVIKHNFKNSQTGKYYNEMSLSMLGQDCPVSEHDRPLWSAWKEDGKPDNDVKRILMDRIASDEFIANVLVIDDKAKPENNGKVFLMKVPKAVMNMISEATDPSKPGVKAIDPFDFLEGHNLVLDFMMPEQTFGQWTGFAAKDIDKDSYFEKTPTPIAETEERIEEIMKQAYSLTEFTDIKHFKTYEECQARFNEVMGYAGGEGTQQVNRAAQQINENTSRSSSVSNNEETDLGDHKVEGQGAAPQQTVVEHSSGGDDLDELEALLNG